jgi:hypothetical protein
LVFEGERGRDIEKGRNYNRRARESEKHVGSEIHFIARSVKERHFARRFPGFARSSF